MSRPGSLLSASVTGTGEHCAPCSKPCSVEQNEHHLLFGCRLAILERRGKVPRARPPGGESGAGIVKRHPVICSMQGDRGVGVESFFFFFFFLKQMKGSRR
jgi:hypothetical protein